MKLKNKDGNKRSKGLFSIIYETYKDFAENTSIHGLKYTVMNEIGTGEKYFWTFVLLSGLVTSVYLTILFWERYVSNPTRTTIMSYYAPTVSIEFPAVTLCNVNQVMDSKVDEFIRTLELNNSEMETLKQILPQVLSISDEMSDYYSRKELKFVQAILERNNIRNMSYLMRNMVQSCSEMVKYCLWSHVVVNCSDVFRETLTVDGYCCSFNYKASDDKYLYTELNGIGTGLTVILDPMVQVIQHMDYQSSGFKVIIHDPTEYPGAQSTTKIISRGKVSYLQLYGTKMLCSEAVRNLPISQRDCYYSDEFELKSFPEYSSSNCLTECVAKYYYTQCGCVPYYYDFSDEKQCDFSKLSCIFDIRSDSLDIMNICNCPSQCEDDYYNVISVYSTFDYEKSMAIVSYGNTTITEDSILLNVFFSEQTQTIYLRDTIFSTVYLLSSFGGVYSLFLGCSLITIVEILYYCFFRFFVNIKQFDRVDNDGKVTSRLKQRIPTVFRDNLQNYNITFLP